MKKLILIILSLVFLCGCSAAEPVQTTETQIQEVDYESIIASLEDRIAGLESTKVESESEDEKETEVESESEVEDTSQIEIEPPVDETVKETEQSLVELQEQSQQNNIYVEESTIESFEAPISTEALESTANEVELPATPKHKFIEYANQRRTSDIDFDAFELRTYGSEIVINAKNVKDSITMEYGLQDWCSHFTEFKIKKALFETSQYSINSEPYDCNIIFIGDGTLNYCDDYSTETYWAYGAAIDAERCAENGEYLIVTDTEEISNILLTFNSNKPVFIISLPQLKAIVRSYFGDIYDNNSILYHHCLINREIYEAVKEIPGIIQLFENSY